MIIQPSFGVAFVIELPSPLIKPPSIGMCQRAVHHKKPFYTGMRQRAVHRKKTAEVQFHTLARGWLAYPVTPAAHATTAEERL